MSDLGRNKINGSIQIADKIDKPRYDAHWAIFYSIFDSKGLDKILCALMI